MMNKIVKFIEVDLPFCDNAYGDGTGGGGGLCQGEIGVTGDQKCFNTLNFTHDCQDPTNYAAGTKTLRFLQRDTGFLPANIDGIPILDDFKITGGKMNPGEDFGSRYLLNVDLFDCRHSDTGIDPYVSERGYIAFETGTFLGKFRARFPYVEGRAIRAYEGFLGQDYSEFTCYNFLVDKMEGPDERLKARIIATDFLKLLNDEKSLAPAPNNGYLKLDYAAAIDSIELIPAGIGDEEYPTSGRVAIGKELFNFTRTATTDVLTLSPAMAIDHKSGEVVQQTLVYAPQSAGLILDDLIANQSPLSAAYTDGATWAAKISEVNPFNYEREIVKPTPTRKLANELIEQVGLVVRANLITNKVDVDVLRPTPTTGQPVTALQIQPSSFNQNDQPEKRYDNAIVYYDKRDPFSSDEPESYYSGASYLAIDIKYPTINTKVIYSQWIVSGGFSAAQAVATRLVARYKRPPRMFEFDLFGEDRRSHGEVIPLSHDTFIQSCTGEPDNINAIIVSSLPSKKLSKYEAEEYTIDANLYEGDIIIPFDYNELNINLRDKYNSIIVSGIVDTDPGAPDVIFIIRSGVVVGSSNISASIVDGDWPVGFTPSLVIESGAYVVGRSGLGGYGFPGAGGTGGDAIRVESALDIENYGIIGGAGGGGGGGKLAISPFTRYRGGSGAGSTVSGNYLPAYISPNTGSGGDLGQPGTMGSSGPIDHSPGGPAGRAIVGVSKVTFTNAGTILGAQIG